MSRILQFVIILVVLNIAGAGVLWYGYKNMQDNKTKEAGLRSQLAEENKKGEKMNSLKETLRLAEQDKEALEKYLLDSSEESQIKLISQMEQIGSSTTGALVTTTSLELSGAKLHGEFAISGTWDQVYYLLRLVELLPTRVVINRFEMRSASDNKNTYDHFAGTLSLDFVSLRSPS